MKRQRERQLVKVGFIVVREEVFERKGFRGLVLMADRVDPKVLRAHRPCVWSIWS